MANRPQFSLKAVLIIIAVLSVPLAMMASGQKTLMALGVVLACPTLGACGGFLCNGDKGAPWGAFIGLVVAVVAAVVIPTLYGCVVRG
jgi:hypothetical protein